MCFGYLYALTFVTIVVRFFSGESCIGELPLYGVPKVAVIAWFGCVTLLLYALELVIRTC